MLLSRSRCCVMAIRYGTLATYPPVSINHEAVSGPPSEACSVDSDLRLEQYRRIEDFGENDGPVGAVDSPMPSVTAPSGSLRGNASLLGGNAPLPNRDEADSAVVSDPQLVHGQEADARLGLYLDFNSADPPQPIRGDNGNTDPGPRTPNHLIVPAPLWLLL